MKTVIIAAAVLIGAHFAAQAAALQHGHAARVSACIAGQRADLAPLDQYGGHLPSFCARDRASDHEPEAGYVTHAVHAASAV